eukprot:TRINITY_DN15635_c0_g1_i3.p1 TRINITY_DN15635_c0_g1~~TRINITY_DN15635_c0_g1_i3.p1  ORF type:complete len:135 (-),score=20.62 TRINITY_DN15635_c0_g1_i3:123-527(-)
MSEKGQEQEGGSRIKSNVAATGCSEEDRFTMELEFVQLLGNPAYLNWLAQNRWFEDEAFLNYLKYLQYWKQPEYVRYLIYPHCLYFLDLLQKEEFQEAITQMGCKEQIHLQQFYFWQHFRKNRFKQLGEAKNKP